MSRASLLPVLVVAALTVAACGSSSKSKTSAPAPAPAASAPTPSAPSTPSTPSTTTTSAGVSASTPIDSPAARNLLTTQLVRQLHISTALATKATNCAVTQFTAHGWKTVGELNAADQRDPSQIRAIGRQCGQQVKQGG